MLCGMAGIPKGPEEVLKELELAVADALRKGRAGRRAPGDRGDQMSDQMRQIARRLRVLADRIDSVPKVPKAPIEKPQLSWTIAGNPPGGTDPFGRPLPPKEDNSVLYDSNLHKTLLDMVALMVTSGGLGFALLYTALYTAGGDPDPSANAQPAPQPSPAPQPPPAPAAAHGPSDSPPPAQK